MCENGNLERYILICLAVVSVYFLVTTFFACSGALPFDGDVSLILNSSDDCERACLNLERLNCPEWKGSPGRDEVFGTEDDVSCVAVCRELTKEPTFTLNQDCVSRVTSCREVDDCFQ